MFEKAKENPNPWTSANFFSRLFFWTNLVQTTYNVKDCWDNGTKSELNETGQYNLTYGRFDRNYFQENYANVSEDCIKITSNYRIDETDAASKVNSSYQLSVYAGLVLSLLVMSFLRTVFFYQMCMKASRNLHNKMFQSILRTPVAFFDRNPAARSPVFSHLSTSLYGLTTIRAFKAQQVFEISFDHYQDRHTATWFMFISVTHWLGFVLDWLCVIYLSCVTVTVVTLSDDPSYASRAGLAIACSLQLTSIFQWGVRQSAEVESQMTSVERIAEYSYLSPEAALNSDKGNQPPKEWPSKGYIAYKNVSLTYSSDDPPVLKNLNFEIYPEERIGIVGRTGAGKSSMIATFFRMTEPDGEVKIDGICTKDIGLHDLRKKISIIPQDPVLFTGPIRRNLDPFSEHKDDELWQALDEAYLKEAIEEIPGGLDAIVSEGGSNFSVGQRQLICLARAVLRRNRVLVLDEATANVDPITDSLIQKMMRDRFEHCTVLTIAHRLHTVIDSDRVLVLDAGEVKEFDAPFILLPDQQSLFSQMVQMTGPGMTQQLREVARDAYLKHAANTKKEGSVPPENEFIEMNGTVRHIINENVSNDPICQVRNVYESNEITYL